jgi:putative oxidoreductase
MTTKSIAYGPADFLTLLLRFALGGSFLFAVADRLGMLGPPGTPGVSWGSFAKFLAYNAQVISFAPAAARNFLGIAATFFEAIFGLGLALGAATRLVAIGSGLLLFCFATAMAVSFGIKSPFDYSVFSAMAGALMLGAWGRYPISANSLWQR